MLKTSVGPPQFIGDFRVLHALDEGGMGETLVVVYEHDFAAIEGAKSYVRHFCLKRVHPSYAGASAIAKRFVDEVRQHAHLHHDNIIRTFVAGTDDGAPYLVMELVHGMNLGEILAQHSDKDMLMPVEPIVHMLVQAADALSYIHSFGIVHRDISPQNLMLTTQGNLRILDFGIAYSEDRAFHTEFSDGVIGKRDYMAPEQLQGTGAPNPSWDMYALGVVAYQLLLGELPFDGDEGKRADPDPELRTEAIARLLDERDDVPGELADILRSMLDCDPDQRPADASEIQAALAGIPIAPIDLAPTREVIQALVAQKEQSREQRAERAKEPEVVTRDAKLSPTQAVTREAPLESQTEPASAAHLMPQPPYVDDPTLPAPVVAAGPEVAAAGPAAAASTPPTNSTMSGPSAPRRRLAVPVAAAAAALAFVFMAGALLVSSIDDSEQVAVASAPDERPEPAVKPPIAPRTRPAVVPPVVSETPEGADVVRPETAPPAGASPVAPAAAPPSPSVSGSKTERSRRARRPPVDIDLRVHKGARYTAEVWLDGKYVGHTPASAVPVRPGKHKIGLGHTREGGAEENHTITVTGKPDQEFFFTFR